jgi:hypothetical protein
VHHWEGVKQANSINTLGMAGQVGRNIFSQRSNIERCILPSYCNNNRGERNLLHSGMIFTPQQFIINALNNHLSLIL